MNCRAHLRTQTRARMCGVECLVDLRASPQTPSPSSLRLREMVVQGSWCPGQGAKGAILMPSSRGNFFGLSFTRDYHHTRNLMRSSNMKEIYDNGFGYSPPLWGPRVGVHAMVWYGAVHLASRCRAAVALCCFVFCCAVLSSVVVCCIVLYSCTYVCMCVCVRDRLF